VEDQSIFADTKLNFNLFFSLRLCVEFAFKLFLENLSLQNFKQGSILHVLVPELFKIVAQRPFVLVDIFFNQTQILETMVC
jgi:hypothetical protein